MAKMISISFKDSEEGLYKYLKEKSSPSIYIKDILKKEMNGVKPADQYNGEPDKAEEGRGKNTSLSSLIKAGR